MKYVVVQSEIDFKWRVMDNDDNAPYGVCYSVANTKKDAIRFASYLDIKASEIAEY